MTKRKPMPSERKSGSNLLRLAERTLKEIIAGKIDKAILIAQNAAATLNNQPNQPPQATILNVAVERALQNAMVH